MAYRTLVLALQEAGPLPPMVRRLALELSAALEAR